MDHARILYNKGFISKALRVLDRLKELARTYNQLTYLQQVLFFEKKIEALFITRSMQDRADQLSAESDTVSDQLVIGEHIIQSFLAIIWLVYPTWSCPE